MADLLWRSQQWEGGGGVVVGKKTLVHGWWKEMKRAVGAADTFNLKMKEEVMGLLGGDM